MTCNSDSAWNSHLIGQKHRKVIAESSLSPDLNCSQSGLISGFKTGMC